jgi:hypothetical protein
MQEWMAQGIQQQGVFHRAQALLPSLECVLGHMKGATRRIDAQPIVQRVQYLLDPTERGA